MKKQVMVAALIGVLSLGCMACSSDNEASADSVAQKALDSNSAEKGEAFISAMKPYLNYMGDETINGSLSVPDELIKNSTSIELCGVEGTVSHGFNDTSETRVSICDWVSNGAVNEGKRDEAVEALRSYYGWNGVSGESDATEEFGEHEYVSWDDTETDGKVSIFLEGNTLHVRWWLDDDINPSTRGDSSADDDDDDYSSSSSSTSSSSRDYNSYSSDDNDTQYLYDEESGVYGVYDEDGSGLFAGDDFAMRLNEDGTGVATDGNGNWVADTDGDGNPDSYSVDGGNTWF